MTTWIAEERVVFVHPDGQRRDGRIGIGLPTVSPTEASCEVALEGMQPTYAIHGEGTLQALTLAIRYAGTMLRSFVATGGRVLHPDGDDVDLDAIFPVYTGARSAAALEENDNEED